LLYVVPKPRDREKERDRRRERERERETEREREGKRKRKTTCVCERERVREREGQRKGRTAAVLPVTHIGWLRLIGSLNIKVAFAKEPYKRDSILQKRPTVLRSLLIVATPELMLELRVAKEREKELCGQKCVRKKKDAPICDCDP